MDQVYIEVQEQSGNWQRGGMTNNQPMEINVRLNEAQARNGGRRVRAVTINGQLVDIR